MIESLLSPLISEATKAICRRNPQLLKYLRRYFLTQKITHPSLDEFSDYDYRLKTNPYPKARIAQKITTEIIPRLDHNSSKSILLDSGSVTYNIAYQMFNYQLCKIVTNNFAIAMLFNEFDHTVPSTCRLLPGEMIREVCAQGGRQSAESAKLELTTGGEGHEATRISVLGLRAYSPEKGITEDNKQLSEFQASLFEHSEQLIVVAQGEKFIKKANAPILQSKDFKYMIDKRREEKSLWFVYHKPMAKLSICQKNMYKENLESFLGLLPEDRVFEVSNQNTDKKLIITDEVFTH